MNSDEEIDELDELLEHATQDAAPQAKRKLVEIASSDSERDELASDQSDDEIKILAFEPVKKGPSVAEQLAARKNVLTQRREAKGQPTKWKNKPSVLDQPFPAAQGPQKKKPKVVTIKDVKGEAQVLPPKIGNEPIEVPKNVRPKQGVKADAKLKYPNGAIRLVLTPERRLKKTRNAIDYGQIFVGDEIKNVLIVSSTFHDDDLCNYLPVENQDVEIWVLSDMHNHPDKIFAAEETNIDFKSEQDRKKANLRVKSFPSNQDEAKLAARKLRQMLAKKYGKHYQALFVKKTDPMHCKFAIIEYEWGVRLVVSSADGTMNDIALSSNHYYIHDLPFLASGAAPDDEDDYHPVLSSLLNLCAHLGVIPEYILSLLPTLSFSRVKVSLFYSIPGTFSKAKDVDTYGIGKLSALSLKTLKPLRDAHGQIPGSLLLEVCSPCIGSMDEMTLVKMDHIIKNGKKDWPIEEGEENDWDFPDVRFVMPHKRMVDDVEEISKKGATEFSASQLNFEKRPEEFKDLFYAYYDKDGDSLPHTNTILMLSQKDKKALPKWMTLGSANFSNAGLGKIEQDYSETTESYYLKLKCTSYELSVFIPGNELLGLLETGSEWDEAVPYVRTPAKYGKQDVPFTHQDHKKGGSGKKKAR